MISSHSDHKTGYEDAKADDLRKFIESPNLDPRPEKDPNKIIREAIKRVETGVNINIDLLILFCKNPQKLIGPGNIFELKNNHPSIKKFLFDELQSRFSGPGSAYRISNRHFISLSSDLSKINTKQLGKHPEIEDRIIQELILAETDGVDDIGYKIAIHTIVLYFFNIPKVLLDLYNTKHNLDSNPEIQKLLTKEFCKALLSGEKNELEKLYNKTNKDKKEKIETIKGLAKDLMQLEKDFISRISSAKTFNLESITLDRSEEERLSKIKQARLQLEQDKTLSVSETKEGSDSTFSPQESKMSSSTGSDKPLQKIEPHPSIQKSTDSPEERKNPSSTEPTLQKTKSHFLIQKSTEDFLTQTEFKDILKEYKSTSWLRRRNIVSEGPRSTEMEALIALQNQKKIYKEDIEDAIGKRVWCCFTSRRYLLFQGLAEKNETSTDSVIVNLANAFNKRS